MCLHFISHPEAIHKQVKFTEVLFQTPAAAYLLICQFPHSVLQVFLNFTLQDLSLDLFFSLTAFYTSMDLFPIYDFCPCENILRYSGNLREERANWFWKHRSPNRYSLLFLFRLSPLPSTPSCLEITSTASFMFCPCVALTFTGQSPNIMSSFTYTLSGSM